MGEKKETPVIGQEAVQYQNLSLGSQGKDVEKLQTALGFTGPDVDGYFGPKTEKAVMDYQRKKNITIDGIAGQETQSLLYSGSNGTVSNGTTTDTINQANQILNQNLGSGSYTPVWEDAAQQYLQQYQDREPFSYDFATDALYQQYADQYANSAKLAMQDTMGQAAAMTGGYGNTWAQHVGQQAYNQQMSQLSSIIPELESRAYDRYRQEGDDLLTKYSLYRDLEDQKYGRWRDAVADYQWQQSFDESKRQFDASLYSKYLAGEPKDGDGDGLTPEDFSEELYLKNTGKLKGTPGGTMYETVLADANEMLFKGANKDQVIKYLQEMVANSYLSPTEATMIIAKLKLLNK